MNGVDQARVVERRKSLKERLGLNGMGCCGAHLGFGPPTISVLDEEEEESPQQITPAEIAAVNDCIGDQTPAEATAAGMNLAAALAAERQYRAAQDSDDGISPSGTEITWPNTENPIEGPTPGTPFRMSLMRLLHETDDEDLITTEKNKVVGPGLGCDLMCCVCMERKKGAAFIPCGHTFCRVCSRELWLNRGSCPLCNRQILEILDIF